MLVAALDVGTNTSDLILIDKRTESQTYDLLREEELFIKLGEGVDKNKLLLESAMDRALHVIQSQVDQARSEGAAEIRIAATSASRDAKNADVFADRVFQATGIRYRILTGKEEAKWTFDGAIAAMRALEENVLVFDIGGGSTELSWGRGKLGGLVSQASMQVGAIRLSERFYSHLPPSSDEIEKSRRFVDKLLGELAQEIPKTGILVGSAGSTPAKLAKLIQDESSEMLEGGLSRIDYNTVIEWQSRVSQMDESEILNVQNGSLRGRERYFLSGIVILEAVMRNLSFDFFEVSSGGVALGVALADGWDSN